MARSDPEADRIYNRAWAAARYANPAYRAAILAKMKRTHRLSRYGIAQAEYYSMCASRGNLCDICSGPPCGSRATAPELCVDHNHFTGFVRGLLCNNCNAAIGLLKDDPTVARRLANYIEEHDHVGLRV